MESRQPPSPSVRKTILVVDADPQSLRIVDVSLRRAGFDVRAVTDGTVAASVLDRVPPPDLVIADTDLPGIDGFELCRRTKSSTRTGAIPFIFLARPHAAHKMRAFELGADDFLAKPVFVTEVVARVSALLQRHERERLASRDVVVDHASGSLADLSTIDLLQTIATNGKSGVLHLRSASGVQGEIYFRRGAVVDAEVGRLSGSDAVYRLLSWTDGRFEIEWRNIRRRDAVALPAPALLMEGMRRLDEWTRITQQLPPLETVFEVDYRLLAERLADIPDEVNGILRLFDGLRTAMQVIDDCGLSDLDALTVIGKLNSEGLIRNMSAKSVEDDKTGPDLEGWLGQPLEGVSPPSAPPPNEPEARLRRVSDTHATSPRPDPGAAEPRKTPTAPLPEWRDRISDDHPASGRDASGIPVLRPDEPAVVIPFPTSAPASNRQTLVSATGGPAAAVAGEISNGVATPSVSGGAMAAVPSSPSVAPSAAATTPPAVEPTISTPRSTDPGLGPVPPVAASAPSPRVAATPAPPAASSAPPHASLAPPAGSYEEHPVAAAPPATARRDSASRVPELPFSDSASRWMTEGDEIHNHKSRADALDEMALPSRFRGWALLAGVVVLAGGSVVAVRALSGAHRSSDEPPAVTSTPPSTTAPAPSSMTAPSSNPSPPPAPPSGPGENTAGPPPDKSVVGEANAAPAAGAAVAAPPTPGEPAGGPAAGPSAEPAAGSADASRLLATCQSAFNAGRMKDATTACTAAVEASPDSAKAIALLAHAEFNRSHRKEALSWAEKASKLDPKLADAYVIIGGVQQDAGRNAEAKSAYRKYLELAPKGQYAADLRAIVDSL